MKKMRFLIVSMKIVNLELNENPSRIKMRLNSRDCFSWQISFFYVVLRFKFSVENFKLNIRNWIKQKSCIIFLLQRLVCSYMKKK
jgi:hypothetical protein